MGRSKKASAPAEQQVGGVTVEMSSEQLFLLVRNKAVTLSTPTGSVFVKLPSLGDDDVRNLESTRDEIESELELIDEAEPEDDEEDEDEDEDEEEDEEEDGEDESDEIV